MNKVSPAPEKALSDIKSLVKSHDATSGSNFINNNTPKEDQIDQTAAKTDIQDQPSLEGCLSQFSTFAGYKITGVYDGEKITPGLRVIHNNSNKKGLGTIVTVKESGKQVEVKWDTDSTNEDCNTGYNKEYDLLLFDNTQTGVKHTSIICNECEEEPLCGIRWSCLNCDEYDLCTCCYMHDAHDVSHIFKRIESEQSKGVEMPPRLDIQWTGYLSAHGILRNAKIVTISPENEVKKSGVVVQPYADEKYTFRSVATVKWKDGDDTEHSVGHEGKCELKILEKKEGLPYYKEHLPDVKKDYAKQGVRVIQTKENQNEGCLGTIVCFQEVSFRKSNCKSL